MTPCNGGTAIVIAQEYEPPGENEGILGAESSLSLPSSDDASFALAMVTFTFTCAAADSSCDARGRYVNPPSLLLLPSSDDPDATDIVSMIDSPSTDIIFGIHRDVYQCVRWSYYV